VPEDVSVVGFDDAGLNAFSDPPLTSVQQPFVAMADATVQLLGSPPPLGSGVGAALPAGAARARLDGPG
jgi:hypothetical protein